MMKRGRAWPSLLAGVALSGVLDIAAAQVVAPASGPNGVAPSAPAPEAIATSPGSTTAAAVSPRAPAPAIRDTSPGTPAAPPTIPTPSLGIPPRVVAPGAPSGVRDPVEPVLSIGPTEPVPPGPAVGPPAPTVPPAPR